MKNYNTDFTDSQLNGVFDSFSQQAEDYFTESGKLSGLLEKVKTLLVKIEGLPVIGPYAGDILDIMDMIADYRSGAYTALPKKSIIAAAGVLLYFATPVDLIPDFIPIVGWADDAAIISFAYKKGIKADIEAYKEWKEQNIFADGEVIDCTEK